MAAAACSAAEVCSSSASSFSTSFSASIRSVASANQVAASILEAARGGQLEGLLLARRDRGEGRRLAQLEVVGDRRRRCELLEGAEFLLLDGDEPLTVDELPPRELPAAEDVAQLGLLDADFSLAVSSARYATACRLCSASVVLPAIVPSEPRSASLAAVLAEVLQGRRR